jgi:hypothetical protein
VVHNRPRKVTRKRGNSWQNDKQISAAMAFCIQIHDGAVRRCGYSSRYVVVNIPYCLFTLTIVETGKNAVEV